MTENDLTFHVSPGGDDAWSGLPATPDAPRTDGPFATLQRARDAIRQYRLECGGKLDRPVTILVRGGEYEMHAPLRLTGGDSGTEACPVTWASYPDETPVLSGGRTIDQWEPMDNGLFRASLPEVRSGDLWFRQLFCDGRRMIRARCPKFDPANPRYGGWAFIEKTVDTGFDALDVERRPLDRTWRFRTDPDESGDAGRWFDPGMSDNDWETLVTDRHWSFQGHAGYHGVGWYRQQLTLPEGFDTRRHLWLVFGSVDKEAVVYIDGERVFEHTMASTGLAAAMIWNTPFRFDVRPWLKPGTRHLVAVRVESTYGGGGIWQPVSLVSAEVDMDVRHLKGKPDVPMSFCYEADAFPRRWAKPEQAEVFVIPGKCWISDAIPIRRVDHEACTIHLKRPVRPNAHTLGSATHLDAGNRFYVENNLEDLTEECEWCLDAELGELYFRPPGGDIDAVTVTAPTTSRLVEMIGTADHRVHHVTFRGLTFTRTQVDWPTRDSHYKSPNAGQTVHMTFTENCGIEQCVFDAVGGDAVRLQGENACDRVIGNHIHDAGAYGIFIGDHKPGYCRHDPSSGDVPSPTEWFRDRFDREAIVQAWPVSRDHVIRDNRIHDVGVFEKHANGIAFFGVSAPGVVVSHNLVHHTPRFGIGLMSGFGDVTIEHNRIHHTVLETADGGAITANRWYIYEEHPELRAGMIIRHNLVHDTVGCGAYAVKAEPGGGSEADGRIWMPYYSWGIYFDNAPMNVRVHGNICARNTLGGIMISHFGNDVVVENNIFVDSSRSQAYFLLGGEMSNVVLRRNIISYTAADADYLRLNVIGETDPVKVIAEHDRQLYHLPEGTRLTFSGLPGEAVERVGMSVNAEQTTFEAWRAMGFDANSIFADPKFVDPANDDYRLQPDSPAFDLGFEPIETDGIGPRA
ncbi:MAG: hypothetical protein CMJ18_04185 [Phycisphaeraceae bacterium]|nr:hypothetical protein [Phycisphaeraceae bacterium]